MLKSIRDILHKAQISYNIRKHVKKCRKRYKNKDVSIICNSCIGGIIYNRLGLRFLSPTIDLWIGNDSDGGEGFIDLCSDLEGFMSEEPVFIHDGKKAYPRAMLGGVKIGFQHYKTESEATEKWNDRRTRINYDNIYVIMIVYDGLSAQQLSRLERLRANGVIKAYAVLGSESCTGLCTLRVRGWGDGERDMFHVERSGLRLYESSFDFVSFLNGNM